MFDGTEGKMIQLPEQKEKISGLTKGTFSFAYRLNEAAVGKTIYGLLSLSNSNADREYGALYIKPKDNRIGYEVQGKEISILQSAMEILSIMQSGIR